MAEVIQNSDIIITGLQPWDIEIGSNCKDIAKELSKSNRVLYVNRGLDRVSLFKSRKQNQAQNRLKVIRGKEQAIKEVAKNLWVLNPRIIFESINFLPSSSLFDFFNRMNNSRLAKEIEFAIQKLGFADVILFNDNDFVRSFYIPDLIPHRLCIYYLRDNLTLQPYFKKRKNLEEMLMKKSDVVLTNSDYLAEYGSNYNQNSFFVGQGFDQSTFTVDPTKVPADLKSISKPTIGYVGSLTSERLDIKLIEHLAKRMSEYSFVLVGPQDYNFQNSSLHDLPNVYFLGTKSTEEVSGYISSFDVCINPQLVNYLTVGNYPRKIDEYLILGKPVVATRTKGMNYFEKYTYLSESYEDFARNLTKAIDEDCTEKQDQRMEFAKSHTWANSVELMDKAMSKALR